jgi:HEPN domain-containing protein
MPEDLAKELLGLARDDEAAARALAPLDGIADAIVGFHCQQAVEKALKAGLASREVDFPKTHDLTGLTELCRRSGLELPDEVRASRNLAPYGVQARYGSGRSGPLDRGQAVRWATAAIAWADGLERSREPIDRWRSRSEHDDTGRADR